MKDAPIYHICRADEWVMAQEIGSYGGSSQDQADGFIHFSGGDMVIESAAKHRAGQDGLVLLEVDQSELGAALCCSHISTMICRSQLSSGLLR